MLADGSRVVVPDPATAAAVRRRRPRPPGASPIRPASPPTGPTAHALGSFVHARSGDKGGDANLGLWVTHDDSAAYAARVAWLLGFVTDDRVRALAARRPRTSTSTSYPLPNLGGVNVVLHGLLGLGVAASTRFDPQAKGLGEWVRSRVVRSRRCCCESLLHQGRQGTSRSPGVHAGK